MGHLYLTVTIDGQLAQCSLFTVSDILKSKLLCALWITIVDISCHTWCGCIVLCVFSSFILSFSFYLMVLFLLNGQLLVWKLAKPEKLSQFCFFKKEIHRGEEKALGRWQIMLTPFKTTIKLLVFSSEVQVKYFHPLFNEHVWARSTTASTLNARAFKPVNGKGWKSAESEILYLLEKLMPMVTPCKAYRWVIKAKSNFLNLQIQNLSGWVGHWYLISWVNFDVVWTLLWYELCYTDKKILSSFFKIYLWITDLFNSKVRGNDNNPWMTENYITSYQIIIFNRKTQQL